MTGQVWSQHTMGCTLRWFGRHLTRHGWAENPIMNPALVLYLFRTISKHSLGILGCWPCEGPVNNRPDAASRVEWWEPCLCSGCSSVLDLVNPQGHSGILWVHLRNWHKDLVLIRSHPCHRTRGQQLRELLRFGPGEWSAASLQSPVGASSWHYPKGGRR